MKLIIFSIGGDIKARNASKRNQNKTNVYTTWHCVMKVPKTKHVLFAVAVTIMIQFHEKTTFLKLISKFRNNKNRIVKTYYRINPIRKF